MEMLRGKNLCLTVLFVTVSFLTCLWERELACLCLHCFDENTASVGQELESLSSAWVMLSVESPGSLQRQKKREELVADVKVGGWLGYSEELNYLGYREELNYCGSIGLYVGDKA